jgi:hypothetical protein
VDQKGDALAVWAARAHHLQHLEISRDEDENSINLSYNSIYILTLYTHDDNNRRKYKIACTPGEGIGLGMISAGIRV